MSEKEIKETQEPEDPERSEKETDASKGKRLRKRLFTAKRALFSLAIAGGTVLLIILLSVTSYRLGYIDAYIKGQFEAKMAYMGIEFTADVYRVTVFPLELELKNATFNDRLTGERLFFIRDARLGLTITDLLSWQLSRTISVDSTEINGAEAWIKFDEDGRSNFANLVADERDSNLIFKYSSMRFTLRDAVIHYGDLSRSLSGTANNVIFLVEPEDTDVPEEEMRYRFDLTSTNSLFVYDGNPLEQIDLRLRGVAYWEGADITELRLESPIGISFLSGQLTNWDDLRYDLKIESTVDLTQASTIFPLGTAIRGVGNFRGTVTGDFENYRVEGKVDSESLTAEGIYLKGLNVTATVDGTNTSYDANGTAIAELLTFGDFRIEFPRLAGNVRGTGTDFRWLGELQAIAVRSGSLTLGNLFLADAVAEFRDRQLIATAREGRVRQFTIAEAEFADLRASSLRFVDRPDGFDLTAPNVRAANFSTNDFRIGNIDGGAIRVRNRGNVTDVEIDRMRAGDASIGQTRLRDLSAEEFRLTDRPASVDLSARNLRAARLDADGTRIEGLYADRMTLRDSGVDTAIYSNSVRIARLDAGGAIMGDLNIAGVRLSMRRGRVEVRSEDIDAGTVEIAAGTALPEGGRLEDVTIASPIYVLEPSGRYRATADMSLGGGVLGSVPLGSARASVIIDNDLARFEGVVANVMDGTVTGEAAIAMHDRATSAIRGDFTGLELAKLVAVQTGRVMPLEGEASGKVDVTFLGRNYRTTSGDISATIVANAGNGNESRIPINGRIELNATNGLFTVETANLRTDTTQLTADGTFDLQTDQSSLTLALRSEDASEIDRLFRVFNFAPEIERQMDSLQITIAGNAAFDAEITGNLFDPNIDASASIEQVAMRNTLLGSLSTDLELTQTDLVLSNGVLRETRGGRVEFLVRVPRFGENNISINAELFDVYPGSLLAAIPIDMPARVRDFDGRTSGKVELSGLPDLATGTIDIASTDGTIGGQPFDAFGARANFRGTLIEVDRAEIRVGDGRATVIGTYDRATTVFDFELKGDQIPLPLALTFLPDSDYIPDVSGIMDITAYARGRADDTTSYDVSFNGKARNVVINDEDFGEVVFTGDTKDRQLQADLTITLDGQPQVVRAWLGFGSDDLPFRVEHRLDGSPLRPFFALIPQLRGISITGTATGFVEFGGNLSRVDGSGARGFTTEDLSGTAKFSQLALLIQDTPLIATEPVSVRFSARELTFDKARFAGGGSNLTIAGTKAFTDDGMNNLSLDGRINLSLLNVFPAVTATDTFFGGFADVAVRLTGVNRVARLSGTADIDNAAVATFIGTSRLTFSRLQGRILFTADQAQVERMTGYLGGGQIVASGGALFGQGLRLDLFRVSLTGTNVTVPLPENFITTGDARLELSGRRVGDELSTLITGSILARRSIYSRDIDLANIVGARREGSLSAGPGTGLAPRFDLSIEGREALIIQNNIADLTASLSLRLTGTADFPQLSGRITANGGTVFFRRDRYQVQRGVLEFPPDTSIEPVIFLQAETEIAGYQIFVNLSGPLTDTQLLNATVRSSPALPQADIVSLITTGNLSNTEAGIPTLAQTGINTAAEILTDAIIANPARRATDRLFGLNVFELDPIISGERLNPSARLTVGRQINNNLRVTYATNLSQDQNQVIALEYRVSNRLSFVAQYEQRSLSNVTRNRDNFGFEIRFRRRF